MLQNPIIQYKKSRGYFVDADPSMVIFFFSFFFFFFFGGGGGGGGGGAGGGGGIQFNETDETAGYGAAVDKCANDVVKARTVFRRCNLWLDAISFGLHRPEMNT